MLIADFYLREIIYHSVLTQSIMELIGSGLMNVSAPFAGVLSGLIAGWLGYAWLFGISFIASIPAMLLIPYLPYLSENKTQ